MARSVQVILLQDVPNLGDRGRVVTVRPGFVRYGCRIQDA
jgi:ribosomal protein L9